MYRNMPVDLVLVRHGQSEGNLAQRLCRQQQQQQRSENSSSSSSLDRGKNGGVSSSSASSTLTNTSSTTLGRDGLITSSSSSEQSSRVEASGVWSKEFRERHNSLYRLTDKGRMQAAVAGRWIRSNVATLFDKYFTSEYVRAMETAAMLALPSARWATEMYLRERDRGVLANKPHHERQEQHPEEMRRKERDAFYWQPSGGESIANLCLRVDRVMENLCESCSGLRVIIVCHGGVIKSFRALIERVRPTESRGSATAPHQTSSSSSSSSSSSAVGGGEASCAQASPQGGGGRGQLEKIHNCQIVWYSRRDPRTGYISSKYNWVKSVCPWNMNLSSNQWREIRRHVYSNEELLRSVRQVPQLVNRSLEELDGAAALPLPLPPRPLRTAALLPPPPPPVAAGNNGTSSGRQQPPSQPLPLPHSGLFLPSRSTSSLSPPGAGVYTAGGASSVVLPPAPAGSTGTHPSLHPRLHTEAALVGSTMTSHPSVPAGTLNPSSSSSTVLLTQGGSDKMNDGWREGAIQQSRSLVRRGEGSGGRGGDSSLVGAGRHSHQVASTSSLGGNGGSLKGGSRMMKDGQKSEEEEGEGEERKRGVSLSQQVKNQVDMESIESEKKAGVCEQVGNRGGSCVGVSFKEEKEEEEASRRVSVYTVNGEMTCGMRSSASLGEGRGVRRQENEKQGEMSGRIDRIEGEMDHKERSEEGEDRRRDIARGEENVIQQDALVVPPRPIFEPDAEDLLSDDSECSDSDIDIILTQPPPPPLLHGESTPPSPRDEEAPASLPRASEEEENDDELEDEEGDGSGVTQGGGGQRSQHQQQESKSSSSSSPRERSTSPHRRRGQGNSKSQGGEREGRERSEGEEEDEEEVEARARKEQEGQGGCRHINTRDHTCHQGVCRIPQQLTSGDATPSSSSSFLHSAETSQQETPEGEEARSEREEARGDHATQEEGEDHNLEILPQERTAAKSVKGTGGPTSLCSPQRPSSSSSSGGDAACTTCDPEMISSPSLDPHPQSLRLPTKDEKRSPQEKGGAILMATRKGSYLTPMVRRHSSSEARTTPYLEEKPTKVLGRFSDETLSRSSCSRSRRVHAEEEQDGEEEEQKEEGSLIRTRRRVGSWGDGCSIKQNTLPQDEGIDGGKRGSDSKGWTGSASRASLGKHERNCSCLCMKTSHKNSPPLSSTSTPVEKGIGGIRGGKDGGGGRDQHYGKPLSKRCSGGGGVEEEVDKGEVASSYGKSPRLQSSGDSGRSYQNTQQPGRHAKEEEKQEPRDLDENHIDGSLASLSQSNSREGRITSGINMVASHQLQHVSCHEVGASDRAGGQNTSSYSSDSRSEWQQKQQSKDRNLHTSSGSPEASHHSHRCTGSPSESMDDPREGNLYVSEGLGEGTQPHHISTSSGEEKSTQEPPRQSISSSLSSISREAASSVSGVPRHPWPPSVPSRDRYDVIHREERTSQTGSGGTGGVTQKRQEDILQRSALRPENGDEILKKTTTSDRGLQKECGKARGEEEGVGGISSSSGSTGGVSTEEMKVTRRIISEECKEQQKEGQEQEDSQRGTNVDRRSSSSASIVGGASPSGGSVVEGSCISAQQAGVSRNPSGTPPPPFLLDTPILASAYRCSPSSSFGGLGPMPSWNGLSESVGGVSSIESQFNFGGRGSLFPSYHTPFSGGGVAYQGQAHGLQQHLQSILLENILATSGWLSSGVPHPGGMGGGGAMVSPALGEGQLLLHHHSHPVPGNGVSPLLRSSFTGFQSCNLYGRDDAKTRGVFSGGCGRSSCSAGVGAPSETSGFELRGGDLPISRNLAKSILSSTNPGGNHRRNVYHMSLGEGRGEGETCEEGGLVDPHTTKSNARFPSLPRGRSRSSPSATQSPQNEGEGRGEAGVSISSSHGEIGENRDMALCNDGRGEHDSSSSCLTGRSSSSISLSRSNLPSAGGLGQGSTPGSPSSSSSSSRLGLLASCSSGDLRQQLSSSTRVTPHTQVKPKASPPMDLLHRQSRGVTRTTEGGGGWGVVDDSPYEGNPSREIEKEGGRCIEEILALQHQMLSHMQQQQAIQTQLQQTLLLALLPNLPSPNIPPPAPPPPSLLSRASSSSSSSPHLPSSMPILGGTDGVGDGGVSSHPHPRHHEQMTSSSSSSGESRSSSPPPRQQESSAAAAQNMLLYFQEGGGGGGASVGGHHTNHLSHQSYPTISLMRQGSGSLAAANREGMKLPFFNVSHDRRTPEQLAGKRTEMNIPPLPVPWPPYATTGGAGGGGGSAYSNSNSSSMSGSGLLQNGVHHNNGGCGTTTALGTPLHCPSGVLGAPTPIGGGGGIGTGPGGSSTGGIAPGAGGGGTSSSFDQHLDALGFAHDIHRIVSHERDRVVDEYQKFLAMQQEHHQSNLTQQVYPCFLHEDSFSFQPNQPFNPFQQLSSSSPPSHSSSQEKDFIQERGETGMLLPSSSASSDILHVPQELREEGNRSHPCERVTTGRGLESLDRHNIEEARPTSQQKTSLEESGERSDVSRVDHEGIDMMSESPSVPSGTAAFSGGEQHMKKSIMTGVQEQEEKMMIDDPCQSHAQQGSEDMKVKKHTVPREGASNTGTTSRDCREWSVLPQGGGTACIVDQRAASIEDEKRESRDTVLLAENKTANQGCTSIDKPLGEENENMKEELEERYEVPRHERRRGERQLDQSGADEGAGSRSQKEGRHPHQQHGETASCDDKSGRSSLLNGTHSEAPRSSLVYSLQTTIEGEEQTDGTGKDTIRKQERFTERSSAPSSKEEKEREMVPSSHLSMPTGGGIVSYVEQHEEEKRSDHPSPSGLDSHTNSKPIATTESPVCRPSSYGIEEESMMMEASRQHSRFSGNSKQRLGSRESSRKSPLVYASLPCESSATSVGSYSVSGSSYSSSKPSTMPDVKCKGGVSSPSVTSKSAALSSKTAFLRDRSGLENDGKGSGEVKMKPPSRLPSLAFHPKKEGGGTATAAGGGTEKTPHAFHHKSKKGGNAEHSKKDAEVSLQKKGPISRGGAGGAEGEGEEDEASEEEEEEIVVQRREEGEDADDELTKKSRGEKKLRHEDSDEGSSDEEVANDKKPRC